MTMTQAEQNALYKKLKAQGLSASAAQAQVDAAASGQSAPKASAPAAAASTPAPAAAPSVTPPTVQLQPGSTNTAAVKQLQDYLVSQGYMTEAQKNTGYGTYGSQTTAAVAKLQQNLGVDNSTGVGYYGPRTMQAASSGAPATGGTPSSIQPLTPDQQTEYQSILNDPNLSEDQKGVIRNVFDAVVQNDTDQASRLASAFQAASQYSDPYFKAQIQLATDALQRGLSAKDGDLAFQETTLKNALEKLKADTAAAGDKLSFDHAQELKNLQTKYETDLQDTQDNLASVGFTSSSKRSRAEQILADQNSGLVESSNKQYGYEMGSKARDLAYNDQNTTAQIENLRRLAQEGKLDLYRTAEESVGSSNLPAVTGLDALGGIGGEIPRKQATDALSFASNFVA